MTSSTGPASTPIGVAPILSVRTSEGLLLDGHDEYCQAISARGIESARNAGVNLAFFSGNEMYWKTRYERASMARTAGSGRWSATRKRWEREDRSGRDAAGRPI